MKKNVFYLISGAGMLVGIFLLFAQCETDASEMSQFNATAEIAADRDLAGSPAKDLCLCLAKEYPFEELSDAEKQAILFMREEEKLARDVYAALGAKWDVRVFSQIVQAEQRHMDAALCLIKKYDLQDPVGNNAPGVFQNTNLQTLYQNLMAEGVKNLPAALAVGAKIEDVDIYDLLQAMPNMNNADVRAVFEELQKGSRNHLRAFVKNLANRNVTYQPEFISKDLFESIVSSPREKGSSVCGTCPNPGNKQCTGNGPNGKKNCTGNGPNGAGKCTGNGPNGKKNCAGNGPNGPGSGDCPGNGPGNGNGSGNGNGPGNGNGGGN